MSNRNKRTRKVKNKPVWTINFGCSQNIDVCFLIRSHKSKIERKRIIALYELYI